MTSSLPENITRELQLFFNEKTIRDATQKLDSTGIQISFQKGTLNQTAQSYFIISGIIREYNTSYQIRLSLKQNENNERIMRSSCHCIDWNETNHCPHIALLYLKCIVENEGIPQTHQKKDNVHPHAFGTWFKTPVELSHIPWNVPFYHLKYELCNGSIIDFPLAQEFKGKIHLKLSHNLEASTSPLFASLLYQKQAEPFLVHIKFCYEEKEIIYEKISILDCYYLFDWERGVSIELPTSLREFLKKISFKKVFNFDEIYYYSQKVVSDGYALISWEDATLSPLQAIEVLPALSIQKVFKRNYIEMKLEILNSQKEKIPLPFPFLFFSGKNGYSDTFYRKNDSFLLTQEILNVLSQKKESSSHGLRADLAHTFRLSNQEDSLKNLTEIFFHLDFFHIYSKKDNTFYKIKAHFIHEFMLALKTFFGESLFKNATYLESEQMLLFPIAEPLFMENVSPFYDFLKGWNIDLYYQEKIVRTWNSQVNFERKNDPMNWFEMNFSLSHAEWELLRKNETGKDYLLNDNELVILPQEKKELFILLKKYINSQQTKKQENQGKVNFSLSISKTRIFEIWQLQKLGFESLLNEEDKKLCEHLLNFEKIPEYPLLPRSDRILRPYQIQGYQWLRFLYENRLGACLADDMGLGKTLQTILFLENIPKVKRILIVCPVSILMNWQKEIAKFSDLTCSIYHGDNRTFDSDSPLIITSYGVMKKEALTTFKDISFDILILDEVQHLKNISSLGAELVRSLKADFRICLTGTPMENNLTEFYNIMDLCLPGIWGDLRSLRQELKFSADLKKRVRPFVLRRTKSQVLTELPEKQEHYCYLNFTSDEKIKYQKTLLEIREKIENKTSFEVLSGLLKLRQLCLWQQQESIISTKINFLLEDLEQILQENHQVLVFSQFTTYLDLIEKEIVQKKWSFVRIDGKKNKKQRENAIDIFGARKASVFLISLKAGGQGLNLTSASYVFLMDPWWNPAVESQAIDRAYRIGQMQKLTVYRPIIKDSVEEKVLQLQDSKKILFNQLLHDDVNSFQGNLTKEDFNFLLS
ncbi:MAG: DEAD/DEAH box helicase [Bacteriovoracaceae bacterium]|nr:DEAD/DEAH box helicase [Bacteriovoracaceae bacterium]